MVSGKQAGARQGVILLSIILFWVVGAVDCQAGFFWGPGTVVTINGEKFSTDDVRQWWKHWKEKGDTFPDTADPFVNWQLLAREAEQMELYQEPSFQHKIKVFLNVRSLLQYKYDKINSRIDITDEMLQKHYQENYIPRLQLQILYFNDKEKAEKAVPLIREQGSAIKEYVETRPEEEKETFYFEERSIRMRNLNQEWIAEVEGLSPGEISDPFAWRQGYVVLELMAKKGADPEDFQKMRQRMTDELRKEMENRLTVELIEKLKKKYEVRIDQEIFEQIDFDSDNEDILDEKLIFIGDQDFSVKAYLERLEKQKQQQYRYGLQIDDPDNFKKRVLNGIVTQTLISRASLDENYQEREPLRPVYQFYRKHRMIKELEKRLFQADISVTEKEIADYYQDNIDSFSQPGTVTLALIQDEEKLVDKMYKEIKRGLPFFEVAGKYYAHDLPREDFKFNSLEPEVREILNQMAIGEVSQPFHLHGRYAFLKLLNRTAASPMPLEHVREKIVSILEEEKFEGARQEFLDTLKARSEINVKQPVWNRLKKEFGNLNAEQEN